MLYLAAAFFGLALVLVGLDLSKLEFARGAGPASTLFLLAAIVCLAIAALRTRRDSRAHVH